jgi:sporulation protein YhbH
MSIFREHKTSADRSASDRARHKQKIEKAIRDGITDVVSEESIIGQDGKKKIRIPVKGIKEWQFVYGDNQGQKQPGSAPGNPVGKGQIVKKGQQQGQGPGSGKPGQEKGEEYYDVEITLDELAEYLFASLNLPELDKKKFKEILQERPRRKGHRTHGIPPRLDKKKSVIERIKRMSAAKRAGELEYDEDGNPIFPFHDNDLRYHHIETKPKENSNAVIFFMMDTSGSMSNNIKFMARSFFFLLYQFIRHKYENVKIVFIGHTTEAYETDEDSFFKRGSSGGTQISSAPKLAREIALDRYHPSSWNIYAFHCSDGDNFETDNETAFEEFKKLCDMSQMVGYCEIKPPEFQPAWSQGGLGPLAKKLSALSPKMRISLIETKNDIWSSFKKFFGNELK